MRVKSLAGIAACLLALGAAAAYSPALAHASTTSAASASTTRYGPDGPITCCS
jgi:hypothetical protein